MSSASSNVFAASTHELASRSSRNCFLNVKSRPARVTCACPSFLMVSSCAPSCFCTCTGLLGAQSLLRNWTSKSLDTNLDIKTELLKVLIPVLISSLVLKVSSSQSQFLPSLAHHFVSMLLFAHVKKIQWSILCRIFFYDIFVF